MISLVMKPARRNGTGPRLDRLAASSSDNTQALSQVQEQFLVARYGIADRARLVAQLAWGDPNA